MAEKSGFFDAHLVNGEYDRVYLAENFAKYFASFIGNGIFGGKSNELMVQQKEAADMSVKVLSGQAWINGYWYENSDELSLAIDVADGVLNRIDAIVLRWDNSERVIRLVVKKGTPATNASAPVIQRNADFYELKLAQVNVKAGATRITQANITDTRLNSDVCGLVIGVVQQLDSKEFGIQLQSYIANFIAENDAWKNEIQTDVEQWADELKASYTNWFVQFKVDCDTAVNNLLTENQTKIDSLIDTKTAEIDELISSKETEFNEKIDELEQIAADNDLVQLNQDVAGTKTNIVNINDRVSGLEKMSLESGQYPGCFYRIINGNTEWINPPSMPGFEYMTTERWNGSVVYQRTIYAAALPNKTVMSIHVNAYFDEIISITGFAIDSDNNMHYQFPIILSGLVPVAVISFAEGDGGNGSDITINTNDDLSTFKAYITVKYTKSK